MAGNRTGISVLIFLFILLGGNMLQTSSAELEQTVDGFSLSGFGQQGEKAWDIFGKSANIFSGSKLPLSLYSPYTSKIFL